MKYEKSAAPRRGLFMAGSSLGVLTLLMAAMPAAVVMAPAAALAADECGVQAADADTINCGAGPYATGITYTGVTVPVVIDDTAVVSDGGINLTGTTAVSLTSAVATPDTSDLQITNTTGTGLSLTGGSVTVDLTDMDGGDTAGSITGVSGVVAMGDGPVSLNLGNLAITAQSGGVGVEGETTGANALIISATGDISGGGAGVAAGVQDGQATVNVGNVSAGVVGVLGLAVGSGGMSINTGSVNTAGGGYALFGNVHDGSLDVNIGGDASGNIYGVSDGAGSVNLNVTGSTDGNILGGASGGGSVNINAALVVGSVSGSASSGGSVNIGTGDVQLNATATATGGGNANLTTGDVAGSVIASADTGGSASATTGAVIGNVTVAVTGGGSANIGSGDVMGNVMASADTAGGVNISTGAVGGDVMATATGGGSASISSGDVTGDVMASADTGGSATAYTGAVSGDVTVTATGGGWATVGSGDVAGSVAASADTGGGVSISTGAVGVGVMGTATGGGSVSINTTGAITNGIVATADTGGAVNVNSTGDVDGGITATSSGGGAVSVSAANVNVATGTPIVATSDTGDVSVILNGVATGDSGFMAQLSTTGSATIGTGAGATAGQADFDVTAGNMLTVNNGGTWNGATDFTGYTSGHFNNMGTWDAAAITFTDGDDGFSNSGTANFPGAVTYDFMGGADSFSNGGTMTAGDLTLTNLETFDNSGTLTATSLTLNDATSFNNGGTLAVNTLMLDHADTFSNGGTLVFGTTAGASTLSLPAVTSLTNTGTIVFGGTTTATDGETNDRIDADGADFTGGGTLRMDVNLNGGNQEDCSAATVADCLNLADGSVSGVTTINLNTVGGAGAGGLNRIVLVDVSGGTAAAGAFKLAAEATPQSLFFYRLDYDAANQQYALDGIPGQGIFEFPQISTSAQNLWYSSTGTYFERQADLRNQVNSAGGPGVWIKVNHVVTSRDVSLTDTHGSDSFDYLLNHKQTSTNVIGGLDLLQSSDAAMSYDVGVSAGHLDSKVDFSQGSGTTDLEGVSFGAYATLLAPSYFLDGVVQANRLDVDQHGDWNTGGFASGKAKSLGAQVEGGWRFHLGEDSFVEPLASLAYVTTKFDDFALPGGSNVNLDDAKSMRGSLGLRVSGSSDMGPITVNFSGIGRHWQEFKGENKGVLESAGRTFALGDDFNGSFDELGVGVSFVSKSNRVSGFFSTSVKFAKDYSSSDNSIGVRIQF